MALKPTTEVAFQIFLARWFEQLDTSYLPRRARTLSSCSSMDELDALAESWIRSGGQVRPSIDPEEGGHGVAMLPDVASEAESIIKGDLFLARHYGHRKETLAITLRKLRDTKDESAVRESLGQCRALFLNSVRRDYLLKIVGDVAPTIKAIDPDLDYVLFLSETIVSELRASGWTDEHLKSAADKIRSSPLSIDEKLAVLFEEVTKPPTTFTCYVSLTLPNNPPEFPKNDETFQLVSALPALGTTGRPPKHGTQVRVQIDALDPLGAAQVAYRRVISTIGALTISLPASRINVPSSVVCVEIEANLLIGYEVQERLNEEKRTAKQEEVLRILATSWAASAKSAADPLHDAIRLRHRALVAADSESQLLMLWSGIERLTSGARGFKAALGAAKELTSHAVAFGKLRREVTNIASRIEYHAKVRPELEDVFELVGSTDRSRIDRERVLGILLGPKESIHSLIESIERSSPLLAYRCQCLWLDLGAGDVKKQGKALASYHERSRERVGWQVGRIYRARNRIAHVGVAPARVRDLVDHAHFYLTQLVAICVFYGERRELVAQEILSRRMGQHQAFIQLLERNDPECKTLSALMRPSTLVGKD